MASRDHPTSPDVERGGDTNQQGISGPSDPLAPSRHDHVTIVLHQSDAIVFGGWAANRIWRLNLPTACWTEIVTGGDVPAARVNHASCVYNGHMLLTGGELLVPPKLGYGPAMSYHELSLDTYEWMEVETFGGVPSARSHHTVTTVGGDSVVVFGGKAYDGRPPTAATLAETKQQGFYDLHILHVLSRTWKRVELYDPNSPMLWGHSAVCFNDTYLLFFGGFDVSSGLQLSFASNPPGALSCAEPPPVAVLSDAVHILHLPSMGWSRSGGTAYANSATTPTAPAPAPRAMHVGLLHRSTMVVFGGLTIDAHGRTLNANDCWTWSVERGVWQRMEFCVPNYATKRLLAMIYDGHLVVANDVHNVFYISMSRPGSGWQRTPCSMAARVDIAWPASAAVSKTEKRAWRDAQAKPPVPTAGPRPTVPSRPSRPGSPVSNMPRVAAQPPTSPSSEELRRLRSEVSQLRRMIDRGGSEAVAAEDPPSHRHPPTHAPMEAAASQHRADSNRSANGTKTVGAKMAKWLDVAATVTTAKQADVAVSVMPTVSRPTTESTSSSEALDEPLRNVLPPHRGGGNSSPSPIRVPPAMQTVVELQNYRDNLRAKRQQKIDELQRRLVVLTVAGAGATSPDATGQLRPESPAEAQAALHQSQAVSAMLQGSHPSAPRHRYVDDQRPPHYGEDDGFGNVAASSIADVGAPPMDLHSAPSLVRRADSQSKSTTAANSRRLLQRGETARPHRDATQSSSSLPRAEEGFHIRTTRPVVAGYAQQAAQHRHTAGAAFPVRRAPPVSSSMGRPLGDYRQAVGVDRAADAVGQAARYGHAPADVVGSAVDFGADESGLDSGALSTYWDELERALTAPETPIRSKGLRREK